MSLLGTAVGALRAVADTVERLEGGKCMWCEESKKWAPSTSDGRIIPIRVSDDVMARMLSDDGWPHASKAVYMRNLGDDTYSFFYEAAEEVDQLSNRVVQQMVGSALDLMQALDHTVCDLSPEAIEALAAFKKAARQRLAS